MKKRKNFNGTVGTWMTSELHPSGASYSSPNSNFSSVKLNGLYKNADYMSIGWFGVDNSNKEQPTLQTSNPYLANQVADARSQNPDIVLFALLAYTEEITGYLKTIINNPKTLTAFATNIASYLGKNGLDGFDIDWEWPTTNLSQQQCALWFNALGAAFGSDYYLAISPNTTESLDPTAVNNHVDLINLQIYGGADPVSFAQYGINPNLLGYGAYFESGQNALQAYQEFSPGFQYNNQQYQYNTIINWRIDSSNWFFEQGQQLLLRQYVSGGPQVVPFNDGAILSVQTTPTLMQSVLIRSGDVVDAIQTTNQNSNASYVVQLLQHGGDGGNLNPPITLPGGLLKFSYVTGNWYGQNVIAQITINGISYPSSVNPSVSNTQTHQVSAPAGKTIIAFKGAAIYVTRAGGDFTWVLAQIDAVFG
ncbi:MAG TPA: glycosyl hydrolase family 18 protein [Chitinophagaceae bacterium]|nr:glycosyl hydrolase family 18 protein [Chitinophagaceae bacterium]